MKKILIFFLFLKRKLQVLQNSRNVNFGKLLLNCCARILGNGGPHRHLVKIVGLQQLQNSNRHPEVRASFFGAPDTSLGRQELDDIAKCPQSAFVGADNVSKLWRLIVSHLFLLEKQMVIAVIHTALVTHAASGIV